MENECDMEIARDARPTKRADILDELLVDGSIVLYDAARRTIITLNPLAAYVWECCTGEQDVRAILNDARALFPDTPQVDGDVLAFLDHLHRAGLIVVPSSAHARS